MVFDPPLTTDSASPTFENGETADPGALGIYGPQRALGI